MVPCKAALLELSAGRVGASLALPTPVYKLLMHSGLSLVGLFTRELT